MKKIFTFIKIIILITFITSCSKSVSDNASNPIYERPDGEYEGTAIDFLADKMVYYYFSIPKKGKSKHNAAIISSLNDSSHGKIYSWEHGDFYGRVRMVATIFEKENMLCRSWVEEVGRIIRKYKNGRYVVKNKIISNKACFDMNYAKWVMADINFHFKN